MRQAEMAQKAPWKMTQVYSDKVPDSDSAET